MTKTGRQYLISDEKRFFDLRYGSAVALAVAPLAIGVAIASMADNRALNPLFEQERVGHNGEPFTVRKFRTIRAEHTRGPLRTHGTFDPRATALGRLLRKSGLDEIPQILSVFDGSMSVVGPRPEVELMLDRYRDADPDIYTAWFDLYKSTRPGLTSASSLYRHSQPCITPQILRRSMLLDLRYADMASAQLDRITVERTPIGLWHAAFVGEAALAVGDQSQVAPPLITGQSTGAPVLR